MIDYSTAEKVHTILIEQFGGAKGIRDPRGLEAALARPMSTFDGNDLYVSPIDKASALFESLIISHPFMDGNKRISYVLMRLFLLENGLDIIASQDEKYDLVISASTGKWRFDEINSWLSLHTKKVR
jgi:death-on-curing protein